MAQNSRPVFRSPSLEQETVEELSRRLLEITAQLNASNRSLQHLQQERTEMLANLSHDLRAPLTAIRSAVDYLTSGQSLSAQDIEGALTLIDHRTGTLEHLIRDMYELFTLEDPSHAFSFQELDAPAFLEEYFYTALPDSHYAGHLLCFGGPAVEDILVDVAQGYALHLGVAYEGLQVTKSHAVATYEADPYLVVGAHLLGRLHYERTHDQSGSHHRELSEEFFACYHLLFGFWVILFVVG